VRAKAFGMSVESQENVVRGPAGIRTLQRRAFWPWPLKMKMNRVLSLGP
jgi:hypothetical protein